MSTVHICNLSVSYLSKNGSTRVLQDFSLNVSEGSIYAIIGPSGCGKSTLLHILAGILTNYSGEVLINGKRPDPKCLSIGLVPQNYGLLPWKRVRENIFLPEIIKKRNIPDREEYTKEILTALRLQSFLQRYPHELSGGQRQRVALARSFIQKPDLLLMDEPFSALDALTAERSRQLFLDIWQRHRVTTLFVTHNIDEAVSIGSQVVLLTPLPGQVARIFHSPTADEVRKLINEPQE
ncbi:NitT/TauT family transport system ATP-binding protein [termite gut metagenome]|uniref:NitT/TauT family transport system ATP-binding protein n=1 Tax=termite gut metagenome TaxID=433724 RepID=A0A5J4Q9M1_9ZZZZ